ncbi:hypothetical protein ABFX02_02G005300 [Erythranthe guttata]
MATAFATLLCSSSSYIFIQNKSISSSRTFSHPLVTKATTLMSSLDIQVKVDNPGFKFMDKGEKVQQIHSIEEYDSELQSSSHGKLVVAHFSATHYKYNILMQQFMEEQCSISNDIKFLHVMANESDKTMRLCRREKIDKIPYFLLYKNTERIHEESGFRPEKLLGDILYYVEDPFSQVVQLKRVGDFEKLIKAHKFDNKLIVVNVGKRNCIPCVKIYPSVIELAGQMAGRVIFGRMNVDDGDEMCTKNMLTEIDVYKVPAFLFMRNGEFCGRYIGSCPSTLIREITKLQNYHVQKELLRVNELNWRNKSSNSRSKNINSCS